MTVSLPLNNRSPVAFGAFPIRIFLLLLLLGRLTSKPAVAGIVNWVVVETVKSEPGFVRIYRKVPFCNVSQLSNGVFRVPEISRVRVVACDDPLFTVTVLKTVNGLPAVFEILADVEPKNVTGIPVKSTFDVVVRP